MENKTFCTGNHILVGLGGTGGKILRAFKMRMFEEFPVPEERNKIAVGLLYVDSTDEMMPKDGRPHPDFKVMGQDASFTNKEFFYIKDTDVEHILDHVSNYPSVKGIVDNVSAVKSAIGSLGKAAGQKRRAGRLLFAANAVGFVKSLENVYANCQHNSGDGEDLNVYIFAGLSGGTGSGSIVDAVVQTRKKFPNAIISVFAMMPEMTLPYPGMDQGRYYPNGYAALNELNALQTGSFCPHDVTDRSAAHVFSDKIHGVANGLTIYSNVNENGLAVNSFTELPKIVSDFIFARIFLFNSAEESLRAVKDAFTYENMDDFFGEYDEGANPATGEKVPVARTKKINSFGIKRVVYPELRIHKHITYTMGEKVLFQFKYNNWREGKGYVNEEKNRDYRKDFLNEDYLSKWKLDDRHLTLELKILPTDADYPSFNDYWHDKAIGYAEEAKRADCPLNELDNIIGDFYASHFREDGVEEFFAKKEKAIPEMANEIRHNIENELYELWKTNVISIVELQRISKLLVELLTDKRVGIEAQTKETKEDLDAYDQDRTDNVTEWSRLGILQRMVGKGARLYAEHQNILTDYYEAKTKVVAWEFAKKLLAKLYVEINKMDADIQSFAQKINEAIDETEKLVTAQNKVNKGLEDLKAAIIEVSEEVAMSEFEFDITTDKSEMETASQQLKNIILPDTEFINFGTLANEIMVDDIKDAFDMKLAAIVKTIHDDKPASEDKVLGLNILSQLQQKLKTDADIKSFAHDIMMQSGAFLKLNNDQIQLHLRNNEGDLSPTNSASINKKVIYVSMPAPDKDSGGLVKFADKLEEAFKASVKQGNATMQVVIDRKSIRKDELSVVTISYCFPMRAIDWMSTYKTRYEKFLSTGNTNSDIANAILLHSESDGSSLPSLFALSDEEIQKRLAEANNAQAQAQAQAQVQATVQPQAQPSVAAAPPVMPPMGAAPMMPPPFPGAPQPEPQIQLFLSVAGQNYGPYDYATCKQLVANKQLTEQSMVWMQGMPAWAMAGQVEELKPLFAPVAMPGSMPPPPAPGSMPPPAL